MAPKNEGKGSRKTRIIIMERKYRGVCQETIFDVRRYGVQIVCWPNIFHGKTIARKSSPVNALGTA